MKGIASIGAFVLNVVVPAFGAVLVVAGVVTGGWLVATWIWDRAARVEAAMNVGLPVGHPVTADGWGSPEMSIETERGFFRVAGSMELFKDMHMTIETRGDGRRWLCQGEPKACRPILGAPRAP